MIRRIIYLGVVIIVVVGATICWFSLRMEPPTIRDRIDIQKAVINDLVSMHREMINNNDLIVFLNVETNDYNELVQYEPLPGIHLEPSDRSTYDPNGLIVDSITQKPGIVLFVKIESISARSAQVKGSKESGNRGAIVFNYHLRKKDGKWIIDERKTVLMS